MTVPQERENDPLVLDILGFGTPARLDDVAPIIAPGRLEPVDGPEVVGAPLTRRELRELERVSETPGPAAPETRQTESAARRSSSARPSAARRSSSARQSSARPAARTSRRTAVKVRRDTVRAAAAPKKSFGKRVLSFAAMLFAGALAVGMTVPANAFDFGNSDPELAESLAMPAQSLEIDPTLVSFSERDTWTVTSWAQMLRLRYGTRNFDYTIGTGPVRWPLAYAVPISSGFGARAAPCRGCSTDHSGIDLATGAGAPVFAMADGVVVDHSEGGSSWGNYVVIQHEIDGETVFTGYAHMQTASSPLNVGDVIKVGDFVGLTGATGNVSGAHLHFTVSIGDRNAYVDPYTYLKLKAS